MNQLPDCSCAITFFEKNARIVVIACGNTRIAIGANSLLEPIRELALRRYSHFFM